MEPLIHGLRVLPLAAPPAGALEAALGWLRDAARGRIGFAVQWLDAPEVRAADRLALMAAPATARAVVARLAPGCAEPLLLFGPSGARPHCWHLPDGRRYALVPADAPLAVLAHELGHLLFHWPDLRLPAGSAARCLMAPVAPGAPDQPSVAMRVMARWEVAEPLCAGMPAATLCEGRAYAWADLLIERQGDVLAGFRARGRTVSLAFAVPAADSCALALASRAGGSVAEGIAHEDSVVTLG